MTLGFADPRIARLLRQARPNTAPHPRGLASIMEELEWAGPGPGTPVRPAAFAADAGEEQSAGTAHLAGAGENGARGFSAVVPPSAALPLEVPPSQRQALLPRRTPPELEAPPEQRGALVPREPPRRPPGVTPPAGAGGEAEATSTADDRPPRSFLRDAGQAAGTGEASGFAAGAPPMAAVATGGPAPAGGRTIPARVASPAADLDEDYVTIAEQHAGQRPQRRDVRLGAQESLWAAAAMLAGALGGGGAAGVGRAAGAISDALYRSGLAAHVEHREDLAEWQRRYDRALEIAEERGYRKKERRAALRQEALGYLLELLQKETDPERRAAIQGAYDRITAGEDPHAVMRDLPAPKAPADWLADVVGPERARQIRQMAADSRRDIREHMTLEERRMAARAGYGRLVTTTRPVAPELYGRGFADVYGVPSVRRDPKEGEPRIVTEEEALPPGADEAAAGAAGPVVEGPKKTITRGEIRRIAEERGIPESEVERQAEEDGYAIVEDGAED